MQEKKHTRSNIVPRLQFTVTIACAKLCSIDSEEKKNYIRIRAYKNFDLNEMCSTKKLRDYVENPIEVEQTNFIRLIIVEIYAFLDV